MSDQTLSDPLTTRPRPREIAAVTTDIVDWFDRQGIEVTDDEESDIHAEIADIGRALPWLVRAYAEATTNRGEAVDPLPNPRRDALLLSRFKQLAVVIAICGATLAVTQYHLYAIAVTVPLFALAGIRLWLASRSNLRKRH